MSREYIITIDMGIELGNPKVDFCSPANEHRIHRIQYVRRPSSVALGCFDGIHLGHMKILKTVAEKVFYGYKPLAVMFSIHPNIFFKTGSPEKIMTEDLCGKIMAREGIETYYLYFNLIYQMSPETFAKRILAEGMRAKYVCCGYNYRFGKNAKGKPKDLIRYGEKYGFEVCVIDEVDYKGEPISSTRIRSAIRNGEMEEATAMLGRPFTYNFPIFPGNQNGRLMDTPTINQYFPDEYAIPKFGVYASNVYIEDKRYPAVTNIGTQPTINGDHSRPRSETWILGYNGFLYGENVPVSLLSYMRPTIRFDSIAELRLQIRADARKSIDINRDYIDCIIPEN